MQTIGLKELLEAGVHFGHQTKRWNPKMKPFIFDARNGIHIIDLSKSVSQLNQACSFLTTLARKGGNVLFVGTKKQAQEAVRESAKSCGQFYVTERWLGGTLTNFATIKKSIGRLKQIEKMDADGSMALLVKQEQVELDPLGSLIDGDMGAYYNWLNQQRLPGAEQSSFLVWFEGHSQALVIGPAVPRGTQSTAPAEFHELLSWVA